MYLICWVFYLCIFFAYFNSLAIFQKMIIASLFNFITIEVFLLPGKYFSSIFLKGLSKEKINKEGQWL